MILNDRIIDEEIIERLLLHNTIDNADEILAQPKFISQVSKMYNHHPVQQIKNLFCGFQNFSNQQSAYSRVQVFLMGVLPCDPYEFTQLFCARCVKTFSFREVQSKIVDCQVPGSKQTI